MNDVTCLQPKSGCYFGLANAAPMQKAAGEDKFGSRRPVNRTVHAAAAEQRRVGSIHNRIDIQ